MKSPLAAIENLRDEEIPWFSMANRAINDNSFLIFLYLPHGGANTMVPRGHRNWIEVSHVAQATVAKFTTSAIVDEEKVLVIGRELLSLVQQSGRRPLILNFEEVERVSTELLGNIVSLQQRTRARGGHLILCNLNPQLLEAFKIVNTDDLLTICEDEQKALMAV
jgi:anti-sigma B factor antagonist